MKMNIKMTMNNEVIINGSIIDNDTFEDVGYYLVRRDEMIDNLISWAAESGNPTDKYLMKADLKYLSNLTDEYIFESKDTNEYIAQSDNSEEFYNICKDLLVLNGLSEEAKN
jgi:hypothetical protein